MNIHELIKDLSTTAREPPTAIGIESSQPAHLVYVPVGGGSPWAESMILVFEETDE